MKKLIWDDDVEEVDLGDGDFITLGSALTVNDMAVLGASENQIEVGFSLLRRLIKSWRGPSFIRDGAPVPVTDENIGRLDMATATELSNRLVSRVTADRMSDDTKGASTEKSLVTSETP